MAAPSFDALRDSLARAIASVLPPPLVVEVDDQGLVYYSRLRPQYRTMTAVRDLLEMREGDGDGGALQTVRDALDQVRDFVCEETAEPWPSRLMPPPHAVYSDGRIRAWYGDESAPDLVLPLIKVS